MKPFIIQIVNGRLKAAYQEDRDHDHDGRHEPRGENEKQLILLGRDREARVGPRGGHPEHGGDDRRGRGDDDRVLEPREHRRVRAEHVLEVLERGAEVEHLRRHRVDVPGVLERGLEHPHDREQHHHGEQREQRDLEGGTEPAAAAHRRRGGLARDSRVGHAGGLDVSCHG
jgi:hypothetical protein